MSLNEAGVAPVSDLCSSTETWFGTASMKETPGIFCVCCVGGTVCCTVQ